MPLGVRFKQSFVTGLIVVVPLVVTGFVLVWLTLTMDRLTAPLLEWTLGRTLPGVGVVGALVVVTAIGVVATTVVGRRLLAFGEALLSRVPVVKDIYVPVKQLVGAFSPDNEAGFKRVVLVSHPHGGRLILGFLTREFVLDDGSGERKRWAAVYIPTNHLYLGDIRCYPQENLIFPDISVQQGMRIILTGGTSFPSLVGQRTGRKVP